VWLLDTEAGAYWRSYLQIQISNPIRPRLQKGVKSDYKGSKDV